MTAAEWGVLLLCSALRSESEKPLTMAQFRELSKRARAMGMGNADPMRDLVQEDLLRLGYEPAFAVHILELFAREDRMERALSWAEQRGIRPITRISGDYPAALQYKLGGSATPVLFGQGDFRLLQTRCISVVGSRQLLPQNRQFAEAAGRAIAREGFTLCSGGAEGADTAAQEAALAAGGSVIVFVPDALTEHPPRERVLYLSETGFLLPFSASRALSRNRLIHAMGEKTLVAQCRYGTGGTWRGTTQNLRQGYSPVFVFADGSKGADALMEQGAIPTGIPESIEALQELQLHF